MPASEKTSVRILYDDKNLYIGVVCYDSDPGRIVHNELVVDGEIFKDDNIEIVIDTFNDKRGGFYFATNPNGARLDGKIASTSSSSRSGANSTRRTGSSRKSSYINQDWNGIWDVTARITDYGWLAEIIIPFKTLRFNDDRDRDWGINFKRGSQAELKPYVLGSLGKIDGRPEQDWKYGGDFKYPLTSDLTLDLTAFTDFAQIESDQEQINLDWYFD